MPYEMLDICHVGNSTTIFLFFLHDALSKKGNKNIMKRGSCKCTNTTVKQLYRQ